MTLKRVVSADVFIEAESEKDARKQVREDPSAWFATSSMIGIETVSISEVKRLLTYAEQFAKVKALADELERLEPENEDHLPALRKQQAELQALAQREKS
ncbi:hypothetical protein ACTOWA_00455 [Herbaspirillum seropedicae]|uniref:hypothetical protein n=1 Tax=Herbaspirillum seropedicae TaxID=964 RepID=UPI002855EF45|nr:hypothetical protein [Herbaspirillum seropedicae]MDR6397936.1 uncharacterized protein YciI [Herbaspirillum seropedicae]